MRRRRRRRRRMVNRYYYYDYYLLDLTLDSTRPNSAMQQQQLPALSLPLVSSPSRPSTELLWREPLLLLLLLLLLWTAISSSYTSLT